MNELDAKANSCFFKKNLSKIEYKLVSIELLNQLM